MEAGRCGECGQTNRAMRKVQGVRAWSGAQCGGPSMVEYVGQTEQCGDQFGDRSVCGGRDEEGFRDRIEVSEVEGPGKMG